MSLVLLVTCYHKSLLHLRPQMFPSITGGIGGSEQKWTMMSKVIQMPLAKLNREML